ncbi:SDR family oxidoreductase [Amnibacterium flavum]|uniref:Nucleoside-diphosphate sugar epimerase n=1 Tax=Amnibacterium flavum TaxID=2173173 RepID=A0A2V1HZ21_9MICO|nr:NAD(P)H-binding protein [Amnibacterium flavum]PVZ96187.1 nucleoside-diphosphate sugar epimerase [Amnibacterium flavum]
MTTLITGATGHIGRLLVDELLARGVRLRALSRNPDTAHLPPAVEVVDGSLGDVPDEIFTGIDAVFLFPAADDIDGFVARAIAAGATRFVVLSSLAVSERNSRDAGSSTQVHHRAVEDAVTSRTDEWTILRPGNFANNLLYWAYPIRSGYPVRVPYPESSQVLIHEADIASAAAAALTEPDHEGRIYELTGPRSLTKIEQLAAISAAIGREATLTEVSPDEFRADMGQYMSPSIIDMLLGYWSETVEEPEQPLEPVLGVKRRTLEQWAVDHRGDFSG